jgi:hypothetical protein
MDPRINSIKELLNDAQKELDEIEWDNPRDPRIEGILRQIRDYEDRLNEGEIYEPTF